MVGLALTHLLPLTGSRSSAIGVDLHLS